LAELAVKGMSRLLFSSHHPQMRLRLRSVAASQPNSDWAGFGITKPCLLVCLFS
jgi:hypothetical protein